VAAEDLNARNERLAALLGRWRTRGRTRETATAAAVEVDAIDTYEWLPGRAGLLHRVDARMGDDRVEGAEVIGYDPGRGSYVTQYFGSDGPEAYEASLEEVEGELVWRMWTGSQRFAGTFSADGATITGHWELLDDDDNWQPWMDITLTREGAP
jgi:Protein of unknown function (DUF1579)